MWGREPPPAVVELSVAPVLLFLQNRDHVIFTEAQVTVGLSAPFTQSYSLLHKNTEKMMCHQWSEYHDVHIHPLIIFLPVIKNYVVCEIYHICVSVYIHICQPVSAVCLKTLVCVLVLVLLCPHEEFWEKGFFFYFRTSFIQNKCIKFF